VVTALIAVGRVRISGCKPDMRTSGANLYGTHVRTRTCGAYLLAYFEGFRALRVREICARSAARNSAITCYTRCYSLACYASSAWAAVSFFMDTKNSDFRVNQEGAQRVPAKPMFARFHIERYGDASKTGDQKKPHLRGFY